MPRFGVCLLALVWSGPVGAQTAAMVRAASVAFHSQRDTLPLTGGQRQEADRLDREAQNEMQAGQFGEALRRYAHAAAVLRNAPWTTALEFAASLEGRIDHAMLEPAKPVTVALAALYSAGGKSTVSVFLVPASNDGPGERELARGAVESAHLPFITRVTIPETEPGTYHLELRLALPDGPAPPGLRELFVKTFPVHIERLSEEVQRLKERLAKVQRRDSPALATVEYVLQFYERTDRGEEGVRRFGRYPFREQITQANAILDALDAGRDPFAGNHGDFRRAYRSPVDHSLQPYRIFIPDGYEAARPSPLVIALHGAGGDENDFFDDFPQSPLQPEAQRHGFLVVCPKGRDPHSGYRGAAEQDIFDVLAEVRRQYRVDASRIYLMGHSMGAYATWRLATEHPDLFAALGPIAGGGEPADMGKIRHIPQYIVHGSGDQTVPVRQSRAMAEAARQAGVAVVYVEVSGAGHQDAAIGQFGPMLDFFARQAKRAP
ncbi:MAG TPA: prolyl oligopeptidase family serine peptidase [Bryobacteraceae bacterium]|jgi:predicted esterase|nr:prolyl oligopeptidase family serine peptidase [Bryobacteraceae bacterium]